ncbi:MAG TPA: carboxypeptidase regulatory-like domain-containing protein, partial [Candidatus Polarisedimenticolia bacterium]|nr:carboxypeptidase regulatory-like domain-containing protein [Candidatus Polarisedimenticolia bacterium]
MIRSRIWPAAALLLVLQGLGVAPARAQVSGTVRGRVIDQDGAPLPAATIAVTSASLGLSGQDAVSDADGRFLIPTLPAADDYELSATLPGYRPALLTGMQVEPGRTVDVLVTLQPDTGFQEKVEVRASPQIVNPQETSTETRLTSEFIAAVPLLGRNYQDLLTLAPGTVDPDGDGNPNIHGARDTDVRTMMDGIATTDPLTGKQGAQLNIESIQEITITTSGAPAEYGRGQGGFVDILTKSGGNEFAGAFKFFWRGSRLDGDGAGSDNPRLHGGVGDASLRDLSFNDYLPFLSLGGPLLKDHAWFYSSTELVHMETPVNALNTAFVAGVREVRAFLKLTLQATANHRVALSWNYDPQEFLNEGLNSFTREESGYTLKQGGSILTLRDVAVLGPFASLETAVSEFDQRPGLVPTLDPDTNHNGTLVIDRNGDGFIAASERDPGEDYDGDGVFDVYEPIDPVRGVVDIDGDGSRTPPGGCEGANREDLDCDGYLDVVDEDLNHNGLLDPGEDRDGDGHLDTVNEDRNHNKILDDRPVVTLNDDITGQNGVKDPLYPYEELAPVPPDRDYTIDQRRGIISGPHYQDFSDQRRRVTLRQDLSVYQPDFWGSHDLKGGVMLERESFQRLAEARAILAPTFRSRREGYSTVRTILPAERRASNSASGLAAGLYLQDIYKPFPNLSISLGLRFDREVAESFGYTPFDPAQERAEYDRLTALAGGERGIVDDLVQGNNDGIISHGVLSDPLFRDSGDPRLAAAFIVDPLNRAALARLTRHHTETTFTFASLAGLYPNLFSNGQVDPRVLAQLGVMPQRRERFNLTNNNLSPRLAVSWDPAADGRTKLFATWGRYYDRLFLSTIVGEEGPDTINRYYVYDAGGVSGSGAPDAHIGRTLSVAPPSTTQVDRGLATPFSDEFTAGFERELAPEVALSVTYIDRKFRRQLQDIDVNHSLRYGSDGQPTDLFGAFGQGSLPGVPSMLRNPDGRPDLYINDFFFNQVLRIGNFNEARYHALEVTLLRRLSRLWELQGSYTYSRALGAAEEFQSRLGNDPSTIESEFGYLDYDQ